METFSICSFWRQAQHQKRHSCLHDLRHTVYWVPSGPAGVYFIWDPFLLTYLNGDFWPWKNLNLLFFILNFFNLDFFNLIFFNLDFFNLNFFYLENLILKNFIWEIWSCKKTISTWIFSTWKNWSWKISSGKFDHVKNQFQLVKLRHNPLWLEKFSAHQETLLTIRTCATYFHPQIVCNIYPIQSYI